MSGTHRWRAPRQDGGILAEPPPQELGRILDDNRRRLAAVSLPLLGRSLADLRKQARQEALAAATQYLQAAGEAIPPINPESLLLAGHQPELFHPGVWVKNFALNGLARQHGCTPLNLVVDNDTEKIAAVRVPVRDSGISLTTVRYDHWTSEIPFEELTVREPKTFAGFADRVGELLQPWGYTPLLPDFWAEVMRQARRTPLTGECFVAARRTFERRWGAHNLEVPLSALCRTEAFAVFACHILSNLPRFHATYNATVQEYRRRHGIRSRNHPVPDLARDGDWYEAPFWVWSGGEPRRRRLFVRVTPEKLFLRSDYGPLPAVVLKTRTHSDSGPAWWMGLDELGFKVRTRALTTTLFSRLLLADLFIHGIGGGKYDELTDELMRSFFECEPPEFLVLSATLLLPLPAFPVSADGRHRLARELRDLQYNPQRHLTNEQLARPEVRDLVQRKRALIEEDPAGRAGRRERFQRLRALSEQLREQVREREEARHRSLHEVDQQLRVNAILQRRDYSFCLFPEAKLRPFCERFLSAGRQGKASG